MGLNVLGKKKLRKLSRQFDMDFLCGHVVEHYVYRVWINERTNFYVYSTTGWIQNGPDQTAAFNKQGVFNGFYV